MSVPEFDRAFDLKVFPLDKESASLEATLERILQAISATVGEVRGAIKTLSANDPSLKDVLSFFARDDGDSSNQTPPAQIAGVLDTKDEWIHEIAKSLNFSGPDAIPKLLKFFNGRLSRARLDLRIRELPSQFDHSPSYSDGIYCSSESVLSKSCPDQDVVSAHKLASLFVYHPDDSIENKEGSLMQRLETILFRFSGVSLDELSSIWKLPREECIKCIERINSSILVNFNSLIHIKNGVAFLTGESSDPSIAFVEDEVEISPKQNGTEDMLDKNTIQKIYHFANSMLTGCKSLGPQFKWKFLKMLALEPGGLSRPDIHNKFVIEDDFINKAVDALNYIQDPNRSIKNLFGARIAALPNGNIALLRTPGQRTTSPTLRKIGKREILRRLARFRIIDTDLVQ